MSRGRAANAVTEIRGEGAATARRARACAPPVDRGRWHAAGGARGRRGDSSADADLEGARRPRPARPRARQRRGRIPRRAECRDRARHAQAQRAASGASGIAAREREGAERFGLAASSVDFAGAILVGEVSEGGVEAPSDDRWGTEVPPSYLINP